MLNNFVIVARLQRTKYEDGMLVLTVISSRPFKNADGIYEEDIFDIVVKSTNMQENISQYVNKGDLIGFKGHHECLKYEQNGKKMRRTLLVADKVSFLSSSASTSKTTSDNEEFYED